MPTRADIEAATPTCPQPKTSWAPTGRARQPCDRPLVWEHQRAQWSCPDHGAQTTGEQLAAAVAA